MKLYLMRHGEYLHSPPERMGHLSENGKLVVESIGTFIAKKINPITEIYQSGITRAAETASLLATCLPFDGQIQISSYLEPTIDPHETLRWINHLQQDTLLVTHQPLISELVNLLLKSQYAHALIQIHPGTMICLTGGNGEWSIEWVIHPTWFE